MKTCTIEYDDCTNYHQIDVQYWQEPDVARGWLYKYDLWDVPDEQHNRVEMYIESNVMDAIEANEAN